jgi:hypothetical protein
MSASDQLHKGNSVGWTLNRLCGWPKPVCTGEEKKTPLPLPGIEGFLGRTVTIPADLYRLQRAGKTRNPIVHPPFPRGLSTANSVSCRWVSLFRYVSILLSSNRKPLLSRLRNSSVLNHFYPPQYFAVFFLACDALPVTRHN